MRSLVLLGLLIVLFLNTKQISAQTSIKSFDEFIGLAETNSLSIKNGTIQLGQAKAARIAAIYSVIDPVGNVSSTYTNNTQLPVNLIPGEVLGGQAGTFKEVQFGVKYNTSAQANTELKLINLQGWEGLRFAKLNIRLTELNNKITLKSLYENCALIYYNIISLQAQFQSSVEHLENANKLYEISSNKFNAGLINQQELNESILQRKAVSENINQIQFTIEQQYLTLKILCDIPEEISFRIDEGEAKNELVTSNITTQITTNELALNHAVINERLMHSNYNKARLAFTPTFSTFASHQEQQFNTKSGFYNPNVNWIPSNYVGLRLNLRIPSAMEISQSSKAKHDYLISKNTVKKERSQQQYHKNQLTIETQKQISQRDSNKEIFLLRKSNYEKNLANYEKGIISIETLIKSMNEMISSQFNFISSQKMVEMMNAKINLNNKIK